MEVIDRESAIAAIVAQHRSGFLAGPAPAEAVSEFLADPPPKPKADPAWYRWAMSLSTGELIVAYYCASILLIGVPFGALLAKVFN